MGGAASGVPQDPAGAVGWFRKAAAQAETQAEGDNNPLKTGHQPQPDSPILNGRAGGPAGAVGSLAERVPAEDSEDSDGGSDGGRGSEDSDASDGSDDSDEKQSLAGHHQPQPQGQRAKQKHAVGDRPTPKLVRVRDMSPAERVAAAAAALGTPSSPSC